MEDEEGFVELAQDDCVYDFYSQRGDAIIRMVEASSMSATRKDNILEQAAMRLLHSIPVSSREQLHNVIPIKTAIKPL
jgi:hypothetical protein